MSGATLFALAVAASGASPPLAAAIDAPASVTRSLSAGQMLALAEQASTRGDTDMAEAIYRTMFVDPSIDVRAEARFRLAMLENSRGRLQEAALLLRRVLDDRPNAQRARFELAGILAKLGDEQSALRELRSLSSANLPPNVRRFVDRMAASLQTSKPFGFQLELALAPDTNINRATRSDTLGTVFGDFTLDQDAKAKSGLGVNLRTFANGRLRLSDELTIVGRVTGDASLYRHTDFNDIGVDLSVGPEWQLGRFQLNAEAGISQRWYGMKAFQRGERLGASVLVPVGSVSQLRVDASARHVDNRFNELQDGRGLSGQLLFERALSPRLLVSASLSGDRFNARDAAYSTRSWRVGLAAYREVGSMTLSTTFDIGRLKADERLLLLPEARSDRYSRLSFGAVFRRLSVHGFAPLTRLVIERNQSSVEFYDYKRTRTEVGISRAF